MAYRNGNYAAFYVDEPFSESNLGAFATEDFRYYNLLRSWKANDSSFPFVDSHEKNYNVRDDSDWERTLKPRLRERLRNSKNIVLFLSSITKDSRALHEEIAYGVYGQGLPVVVVYPEFSSYDEMITGGLSLNSRVTRLWDNLPVFCDAWEHVACVHVPLKKELIRRALEDPSYTVQDMCEPGQYRI